MDVVAQPWIVAAFIVAGISATFKLQYQALMYLLTVIYAVQDINGFLLVTTIFAAIALFNRALSAASR